MLLDDLSCDSKLFEIKLTWRDFQGDGGSAELV